MDSKAKGARTVVKCVEYYTNLGYLVGSVEKSSRFVKEKDLFGLFDLVGIKKSEVVFIQVKTNRKPPDRLYSEFALKYCDDAILCEVYVWHDRKGPVIYKYKNENVIKEDLRK